MFSNVRLLIVLGVGAAVFAVGAGVFAWLDGMVEGRRADAARIAELTRALEAAQTRGDALRDELERVNDALAREITRRDAAARADRERDEALARLIEEIDRAAPTDDAPMAPVLQHAFERLRERRDALVPPAAPVGPAGDRDAARDPPR